MKTYTDIIWDFNGTVLDDMQACIDSVNPMLAARGLPVIGSLEQYRTLFDFPIEDYYRRLGFDFEKEPYHTVLAPLWVENYLRESRSAPLFADALLLAARFRAAGAKQSILSATEKGMLTEQLRERGALPFFDEIWGCDNIHAYGKTDLARAWRAAHPAAVPLFLGDTTHDAAAARVIGADCVLVASGHQSREKLQTCGATVVNDLSECASMLFPELLK